MKYRRVKAKEKLQIIEEAKLHGVIETCRAYGISPSTYYGWTRSEEGSESTEDQLRKTVSEIRRLEEENLMLKKLLAEKELSLEIKEQLHKKILYQQKRNG